MRNTKKAFTLVELIVVITILAILATVAFVSLSGYSQDAKNSKVKSDIASLRVIIDSALTKDDLTVNQLVKDEKTANKVDTSKIIWYLTSTGATTTWALSSLDYKVWTIDFAALRQNGDKFKDNDGNTYYTSYAATGSTAYFQVAGQIKNKAGQYNAVVEWNYYKADGADLNGLIADKAWQPATGLTDNYLMGTGGLY